MMLNLLFLLFTCLNVQYGSSENFYIVTSGLSQFYNCPRTGFDIEHCITLQQYIDRSVLQTRNNISLELEPGYHVMTSNFNLLGDHQNTFTMNAANGLANVLCIGNIINNILIYGGIRISRFHRTSLYHITFIECVQNLFHDTNEVQIHDVQLTTNYLSQYLLRISSVANATILRANFLCSRSTGQIDTPMLSIAASSLQLQLITFSNDLLCSRITGLLSETSDISIENSLFSNFSARAIETTNSGGRSLTVIKTVFQGNSVSVGSGGPGGAIQSSSSKVVIHGCQFVDNSARVDSNSARASGGALSFIGANVSISVSQSTFRSNAATGHGGAISFSEGILDFTGFILNTLLINESDFINNTAQFGGAIVLTSRFITTIISDSRFSSNLASRMGGAIAEYGGNTTTFIERCVFTNNEATQNGGAISTSSRSRQLLTVSSSTFINNRATSSRGGAIYQPGSTVSSLKTQIDNCTFSENVANHCGAINIRRATIIKSCSFSFNKATTTNTQILGGGAGCLESSSSVILNSTFWNNTSGRSGGALYLNGGKIKTSSFDGNRAGTVGGAIFGAGQINQSTFTNNHASRNGGALSGGSIEIIQYSNFENNTAANGGAIGVPQVIISNSDFAGNEAMNNGGAIDLNCIFCASGSTILQDTAFVRNRAMQGFGGAINLFGSSSYNLSLIGNNFCSNSAPSCGAFSIQSGLSSNYIHYNIDIIGNIFISNRATPFGRGGGACCIRSSNISIRDSNFNYNRAPNGGVMQIEGSTVSVQNSSFVNNLATFQGGLGGVFYTASFWFPVLIDILESSFINNTARQNGGAIVVESEGSAIQISESIIVMNYAGTFGGAFSIDGVSLTLNNLKDFRNTAVLSGNTISACNSNITVLNTQSGYFYNISKNEFRSDLSCVVYEIVRNITIDPSPTSITTIPTFETSFSNTIPTFIHSIDSESSVANYTESFEISSELTDVRSSILPTSTYKITSSSYITSKTSSTVMHNVFFSPNSKMPANVTSTPTVSPKVIIPVVNSTDAPATARSCGLVIKFQNVVFLFILPIIISMYY